MEKKAKEKNKLGKFYKKQFLEDSNMRIQNCSLFHVEGFLLWALWTNHTAARFRIFLKKITVLIKLKNIKNKLNLYGIEEY